MEVATSDLFGSFRGNKDSINMESDSDEVQIANIIKDIRVLLNQHNNPKEYLNDYLRKVEENMEQNKKIEKLVDKSTIRDYIEKHPYFKNPCSYHIRLLTIMKYLKKKGIDINIKDMDLIVDEVIQEIDGVKKVGEGRYIRTINGKRKS
ncbi:MAG: hypothetical protein PWQ37_1005 [Candidatus Petromonas sp.]|nr:hypothetical protein [Candidatus Petromonas sp.]